MTIQHWLNEATNALTQAGIESARLDALVLLSDQLQKDKSWLLAYPEHKIQGSVLKKLNTKVAQRVQHTPLAYIRGHVEFYGNTFIITKDVLVPRPESEAFLEILRTLNSASFSSIIDVGTGSGALAISATLLCPAHPVFATDVSDSALAIAKENAKKNTVDISFLSGHLIEPISDTDLTRSILLCNLPYVPLDYTVNKAATHEPKIALYSGKDGLDHYTALFRLIAARKTKPRYIVTESLLTQHEVLWSLALQAGYQEKTASGLVQLFELT
jgi:release factor glutamine methyltransferase